ncbi:hypothetical protein PUW24_14405 [Paenibacillus urinalis]|uniref:Beta-lactamase-related domain-containing protein n=1 Tax=Paenibacillus urinalis TaxID=521520 RepID=A0AAX3N323_9BACL|nr:MULTISPECIES: hypothetical protein [Paenibacillus]WDH83957.1 hypothetical protein PUW23_07005 [Paenibacillus urinalis]WDH95412.1 hypothetical protein PUW24_14405 [Paenibacillus urinalis]WDI03609.1 hypothetical protein PUW25_06530 [Paenibacillus urinalis]GAK40919.1 hypothetical protein TCA2_3410 [Paenibacillus sp. TCA20]
MASHKEIYSNQADVYSKKPQLSEVLFHNGGIHGFGSFLCRFPEDEVCVIALSNYSQDIGGIAVQVSQE